MSQYWVYCTGGHRVVSFTPVACRCGREHRLFKCRMRRGSTACGWSVLTPAMGPGCYDDKREDD